MFDVAGPQPSGLESSALGFATTAHKGQKRKYTKEPYINHPIAVASIVRSIGGTSAMIAAAYLHDVMEDCEVSFARLRMAFGYEVADYVRCLTDPECLYANIAAMNRAHRKRAAREQIGLAPHQAKTIKLADLIHNTGSIIEYDEKFAKVYLEEKRLLMPFLRGGNAKLWDWAAQLCDFNGEANG